MPDAPPVRTPRPSGASCAALHGGRLEKALAEYQAQAKKPFDHEAHMKELLARQAELNAALDLDKNETQVAPPAEDDVELAADGL